MQSASKRVHIYPCGYNYTLRYLDIILIELSKFTLDIQVLINHLQENIHARRHRHIYQRALLRTHRAFLITGNAISPFSQPCM